MTSHAYFFVYFLSVAQNDGVRNNQREDRDMKRQIHRETMLALELVTQQEQLKVELLQVQIRNEKAARLSRWQK